MPASSAAPNDCAVCGKSLPHAPTAKPCRAEFLSGTGRRFFCPNDGAWVLRDRACPTCGVKSAPI